MGTSAYKLATDYQPGTEHAFSRLYIQPGCAESTFIKSLLIVLLDATFFLNIYNQVILLAIVAAK